MHIKFINRGTGSATSAKEYLLQECDHKGEKRTDVTVLRGNPEHVTAVADSLDFKHKYTSGVIAWHVDDNPTVEQINEVLDDFERVAFAGLDGDQYCYYAIQHEESNGAKHVHIVAPRVELSTGLSMNIAPPNWQKTYDVLRDKYNIKNKWARPEDVSRMKLANNQVSIHSNMSHTKAKVEINKAVMELIERGVIKNEDDVTKYLNSIDGVMVKKRRSKKSLSIELVSIKKPIRLEGLAYAKGFDVRELRQELRQEQKARIGANKEDRSREYERISEVFESVITGRAAFNRKRYKQRKSENQKKLEQNKNYALAGPVDNGFLPCSGVNTWELRPWELDNQRFENDSRNEEEKRRNRQLSSDSQDLQQRDRAKEETASLARRQRELDSDIRQRRAINDAIRARIEAGIETAKRDVQERVRESNSAIFERIASNRRYAKQRIEAIRQSYSANSELDKASRRLDQEIGKSQLKSYKIKEISHSTMRR